MSIASILEAAPKLAVEWASEREDRQRRTDADPAEVGDLETFERKRARLANRAREARRRTVERCDTAR